MSKFHWFGDSWLVGSELEKENRINLNQTKQYAFPKLVSNYFNVECVNLSEPGISNDLLPLILHENLHNIDPQHDTVFFCLTSQSRASFLGQKSEPLTVLPSIQDNTRRSTEHPHWKQWYKYFDTQPQQTFNYDRTVDFLFFWCQQQSIKFYFLNIFTTLMHAVIDLTTPDVWLLPRNQCLANFILPVLDAEFGSLVLEDRSWVTSSQWAQQQQAIDQYIKPCFCHPNLLGHKKISQEIILLLQQQQTY